MKIKRKILVQMADPAGNKTAFVLNGARREDYAGIAEFIMEHTDTGAEQVGFVNGVDSFDMSGMEFCGNAARAFALLSAMGYIDGKGTEADETVMSVTVSGRATPVSCEVNRKTCYTKISMPLPKRVKTLSHCGFKPAEGCKVLVFDGIIHLILEDVEYTSENFDQIKQAMTEQFDPPALGVMYLDRETLNMTPVVFVKDVGSVFVEGSCGSGTTAAAAYLSDEMDDGEYSYEICQPGGTILATAVIKDGKPDSIYIEGPVGISEPVMIEAEYEAGENELENMSGSW